MKNIFIAGILLLTSASYAQITISQEKNIADAMELKKEIARTESAFQVQKQIQTIPCIAHFRVA